MEGGPQDRNYIHFEKRRQSKTKETDKEIYRIFPIEHLIEIFEDDKNTLVKPTLWDDPFENFVLNSLGQTEEGEYFSINAKDQLYGQCWTEHRESDAMWRIYSPEKRGVRVRTTSRKLLNSLWNTKSIDYRELSCFIGRVQYVGEQELMEMLDNPDRMEYMVLDQQGRGQASTLLLKREEFKHEREVRLIHHKHDNYDDEIFRYPIEPCELIDQITFDPRLSSTKVDKFKSKFRSLGFEKRIDQSRLYKLPKKWLRDHGIRI